ncbi:HTH domain-containing protein [Clostridium sp. BJN0013]|uniref:HTH domain-containing protein n=1 Tax=Clostridium sp. BJN0013 TaxID=3236840 RepID=UPI0034C5DC68
MAEEIQAIGNKDIEETINTLKKDYGMSTECLSYLLRVKSDGDKIEIPTGFEEKRSFTNLIFMLDTLSKEEPDFKFKAFLEVLVEVHKISADTIAKLAKIPTQYVLDFMIDSSTVPIEIKYRVASVIMVLRFIFKTVEPKI